jgi:DNA-directed RNA polymerase specialized sigma24 family protein
MITPESQERFQSLLEEHKKILFKICNSYCRDRDAWNDLAQEIIVQLWRSFGKFDGRMGRSPIAQRLMRLVAGYDLNAATGFLATLSDFESENS